MPWGIILEGRDCAWVCHTGPLALRGGLPWCRRCVRLLIETLFHLRASPRGSPALLRIMKASRSRLAVTLWTAARQAPLSVGFPRWKYWGGSPFPPPGDLPNPGTEPTSPGLAGGFFITASRGKAPLLYLCLFANLLIHWPKAKTEWVKCWLVSCVTLGKFFYLYSSWIN